jgi:hypothetical protein
MAKVEKVYQVKKTRNGRETIFEGTLSHLIDGTKRSLDILRQLNP